MPVVRSSVHRRRVISLASVAVVVIMSVIPSIASGAASKGTATASTSVKVAHATSCIASATAAVTAAEKNSKLTIGPKFSIKKLKGKHLAFVADDMALGIDAQTYAGFKGAAKAAGITTSSYDGLGNPTGYVTAMSDALATHPAGIVFDAIGPNFIGAQLAQAKKEHIPTVGIIETGARNETAYTNVNDSALGKLEADSALMQTNCQANVIMFDAPAFATMATETNGASTEFANLCPSCGFTIINQDIDTLGTATGTAVTNALESNPNVNVMLSAFDVMSTFMEPAIQAIPSRHVILVGSWSQANTLAWVQSQTVETATITIGNNAAEGWGGLDQLARVMLHLKPSKADENITYQLVDKANVNAAISNPGYAGFQQRYLKTWGLKK